MFVFINTCTYSVLKINGIAFLWMFGLSKIMLFWEFRLTENFHIKNSDCSLMYMVVRVHVAY